MNAYDRFRRLLPTVNATWDAALEAIRDGSSPKRRRRLRRRAVALERKAYRRVGASAHWWRGEVQAYNRAGPRA